MKEIQLTQKMKFCFTEIMLSCTCIKSTDANAPIGINWKQMNGRRRKNGPTNTEFIKWKFSAFDFPLEFSYNTFGSGLSLIPLYTTSPPPPRRSPAFFLLLRLPFFLLLLFHSYNLPHRFPLWDCSIVVRNFFWQFLLFLLLFLFTLLNSLFHRRKPYSFGVISLLTNDSIYEKVPSLSLSSPPLHLLSLIAFPLLFRHLSSNLLITF